MIIILVVLYHFIVTLPWNFYYWVKNLWFQSKWYFDGDNYRLSGKKMVVFIPGRDGNCGSMIPLVNNIVNLGTSWIPRIIDLGTMRFTQILEDVKNLQNELQQYPDSEIVIVGFSKGGLVALNYQTLLSDPRIKKIITVSSPVQGTQIASIFPKRTLTYKELSFLSDSIKEFLDLDIGAQVYHIVPVWDHLIIPSAAARHPKTPDTNVYTYTGYNGHGGITHSMEVAQVISNWLK